MEKLSLKMRLVGTAVKEDRKLQDSLIVTRFRGLAARGSMVAFSKELERVVFELRIWKASFSTGQQPGMWKMILRVDDSDKKPLAEVIHCTMKDLRFSLKVIKKKKKDPVELIFLTLLVEHGNNPAQKAIVCAVPSTVTVTLEKEEEEIRKDVEIPDRRPIEI